MQTHPDAGDTGTPPPAPLSVPVPTSPYNIYKANLLRIIDADTVLVDTDLGFHFWFHDMRIRLAHINAPEANTEAGKAATAYLVSLLAPIAPPQHLTLQTIHDQQDNYGRYLGILITPDGVNVNDALVQAGHAVVYKG